MQLGNTLLSMRLLQKQSILPCIRCQQKYRFRYAFSTSSRHLNEHLESVRPMFDLKGRNFVVTGGGQGIGFATVRAICEMGGNVSVLDKRQSPVEAFRSLASEFGVTTRYIPADVTQKDSLRSAFEQTISVFGSIDGWLVFGHSRRCS